MDLCHAFDRAAMADKRTLIEICSTRVPCGPKDVEALRALNISVQKTNNSSVAVRNFLFRFVLASEEERTTCAQTMIVFAHEHGILSCAPVKVRGAAPPMDGTAESAESAESAAEPPFTTSPLPGAAVRATGEDKEHDSCFDCPACRWKRLPVNAALTLRPRGIEVNGEQAFSCVDWNAEMMDVLSPEIIDAGKALLRNLTPRALRHIHLKDDNATLSYQVAVVTYDSAKKLYMIRRARDAEQTLAMHPRDRAYPRRVHNRKSTSSNSGDSSESDL